MRIASLRRAAAAAALAACASAAPSARAQDLTATPLGELTLRYRHFEGLDFAPGGGDDYVRQRARLGLRFAYGDEVQSLIELQDVRVWGEESDPAALGADGLDLHQGYIELELGTDFRVRLGRQEINYLNQRLIGANGFDEAGRAFDAVRFMGRAFNDSLSLDAFYAHTLDGHASAASATDAPPAPGDLFAFAIRWQADDYFQPSLIGVVDVDSATSRVRSTNGILLTSEWPFGLRVSLEGYLQAGGATLPADDANAARAVSFLAWMSGAHVRWTLRDADLGPFVEAFGEVSSGDADASDAADHTFDTLFGTSHRFHGEADLFADVARDSGGRGLVDVGAIVGLTIGEDGSSTQVAFHHFGSEAGRGGATFADELDAGLVVQLDPHLSFDFDYSMLIPGDAVPGSQLEHFVYLTASASF